MFDPAEHSPLIVQIPDDCSGMRIDAVMAKLFPDYSRSHMQQWIRDGLVLMDGVVVKPKTRVAGDETLQMTMAPETPAETAPARDIPLEIVYRDEHLLVINKQAGLVVHPAAGHHDDTLVNGLLFIDPGLELLPRAGIVHRLDRDTSGLMMVARSLKAHKTLVGDLQKRRVKREYQAIVQGVVTAGGTVDAPIGRHSRDRKRMAIRDDGKPAITHYRVIERFRAHTLLRLELDTGRTHQIRVHMQSIHHPLVGDPVYGGRQKIPPQAEDSLVTRIRGFKRQALHAFRLGISHPVTADSMTWQAELPDDMVQLLAAMREDSDLPGD